MYWQMLGHVQSHYIWKNIYLEKYNVIFWRKTEYNKQHVWGMLILIIIHQAVSHYTTHGYVCIWNWLGFYSEVADLKHKLGKTP